MSHLSFGHKNPVSGNFFSRLLFQVWRNSSTLCVQTGYLGYVGKRCKDKIPKPPEYLGWSPKKQNRNKTKGKRKIFSQSREFVLFFSLVLRSTGKKNYMWFLFLWGNLNRHLGAFIMAEKRLWLWIGTNSKYREYYLQSGYEIEQETDVPSGSRLDGCDLEHSPA